MLSAHQSIPVFFDLTLADKNFWNIAHLSMNSFPPHRSNILCQKIEAKKKSPLRRVDSKTRFWNASNIHTRKTKREAGMESNKLREGDTRTPCCTEWSYFNSGILLLRPGGRVVLSIVLSQVQGSDLDGTRFTHLSIPIVSR